MPEVENQNNLIQTLRNLRKTDEECIKQLIETIKERDLVIYKLRRSFVRQQLIQLAKRNTRPLDQVKFDAIDYLLLKTCGIDSTTADVLAKEIIENLTEMP